MATKKTSSQETSEKTEDPGSFELSLGELRRVVVDLEGGELDLTASLERYEQGIRRLKECHQFLDSAQQKVSQLTGFDADGNPVLVSMVGSGDENLDEKQQARQQRRSATPVGSGATKTARRPAKPAAQDDDNGIQNDGRRSGGGAPRASVDDSPELF